MYVCMYVCMYFCLDCISFCLEDTRSDQKRKKAIVGCRIPTQMLFATLVLKGNISPFLKNIICAIWLETRSKYISARLLCWKGSSHTCLIVWHVLDIICSLITCRRHVLKPGTPEHPGTTNLTVLVCFPITDHAKKK